jgi:hypothetical protein
VRLVVAETDRGAKDKLFAYTSSRYTKLPGSKVRTAEKENMKYFKCQLHCTFLLILLFHCNKNSSDSTTIIIDRDFNRNDTVNVVTTIDSDIIGKKWILDRCCSSLNDSIQFLFEYGIINATLQFDNKWGLHAVNGGYFFGSKYRITTDRRFVLYGGGTQLIYCNYTKMNNTAQLFNDSYHAIINDSKYRATKDSLYVYFQTGLAIFIDSSKIDSTFFKKRKYPETQKTNIGVDDLIGKLMDEYKIGG